MFCQMTLILADVHIAELGLVVGFGGQPPAICALDRRQDPGGREVGWRRAARAMKIEDQAYRLRLAEMAKRHSGEET